MELLLKLYRLSCFYFHFAKYIELVRMRYFNLNHRPLSGVRKTSINFDITMYTIYNRKTIICRNSSIEYFNVI